MRLSQKQTKTNQITKKVWGLEIAQWLCVCCSQRGRWLVTAPTRQPLFPRRPRALRQAGGTLTGRENTHTIKTTQPTLTWKPSKTFKVYKIFLFSVLHYIAFAVWVPKNKNSRYPATHVYYPDWRHQQPLYYVLENWLYWFFFTHEYP